MNTKRAGKALKILAEELRIKQEEILACIVSGTPGAMMYLLAGDPRIPVTNISDCKLNIWQGETYIEMKCYGEKGMIDFARFMPHLEKIS